MLTFIEVTFMEKLVGSVEIPQGIIAEVSGNFVKLKAGQKENSREFKSINTAIRLSNSKIEIYALDGRKKTNAEAGSIISHIRNMVNGLEKEYEYKLEIVYSHFPLNVVVKGNVIEINNLGGAKNPKKVKIAGNTKVEVKGKEITVRGTNKEHVGQTAANMEMATKIKGKDIRIFHDGIYIVSKK